MKKIISILLALGLVLGLTVIAAPAGAQCLGTSVKNCAVKVDPAVACETKATFNITFNVTSSLIPGDDITVKFDTGCNVSAIVAADVKVNSVAATTVTPISATELRVVVPGGVTVPAGNQVRLDIENVVLPGTEGTYKIWVSTSRDVCPCEASFTIAASGTITPTSVQWGINSGKNITVDIIWNGSKNISDVYYAGASIGSGNWAVNPANNTSGKNLTIAASYLQGLGLNACASVQFKIEFEPGCNRTLTVTVHECDTISLVEGWNLISLPKIPKYKDITKVLADIDAKVNSVWYYDCGTWYVYKNGTGFQSLKEMDAGKAYWIDMKAAATLMVCGYAFPCPPAVPPKYCYHECWNLVGFKSQTDMPGDDYMGAAAGAVIGVLTWNGTAYEVVDLASDNLTVGRGYWMAFKADACVVPPLT